MNIASRISAYSLILPKRWAECPYRKYAAQPRRNRLMSPTTTSTGSASRAALREFPDPVPGVLHRLVRGPAGEEGRRPPTRGGPGRVHQPVVKTEEVHSLASHLAGARSGSWPLWVPTRDRPAVAEAAPARPRPAAGTCTSPARRRRNAPEPRSRHVPCPVEPVQVDVGQQRGSHPPNAMGNFCFDVTLGYRRVERPRRVADES